MKMNYSVRLLITFVLLIWLLGIFIEWLFPLIPQLILILPFLEHSYSLVCHQQENKLVADSFYHSLVCSRCVGIYIGLLFSSICCLVITIKKDLPKKVILFAVSPMLADVILSSSGFYNYSKYFAFITGFLLGSVGFLYFYSALIKLIEELKVR